MKIMVLNLGSTSFKFKLFDMAEEERLLASGAVERIGRGTGSWRVSALEERTGESECQTHEDAFVSMLDKLTEMGVLRDLGELDAVGYKAVHGGPLSGAALVTPELMEQMERCQSFAPAHNPMYLRMMRGVKQRCPGLVQVACFETAFHATIPLHRAIYGVPYEWVERYGVRRYGFHGSSHSYIAMRMAQLEPGARRLISIHLGGSSSLCAILDARSIACSMGATPQSGLFHNNRVGDFDVFCLPALTEAKGSQEAVLDALSSQSGFLGISGVSGDMRDILTAMDEGNERAKLAFDSFCDNVVGYIGMFSAYLGGLDAICFTGGIGQHCPQVRRQVCAALGIGLDEQIQEGKVSRPDSPVAVYVLETNEELMVARGTKQCLTAASSGPA